MNIELIISLIAIFLSIYNFLYNVISNWTNIDAEILGYIYGDKNVETGMVVSLMICNKSTRPITISRIEIISEKEQYEFYLNEKEIARVEKRQNNVLTGESRFLSINFPLTINGLGGCKGQIVTKNKKKINENKIVTLKLYTTIGTITKKVKMGKQFSKMREMIEG